jgi:hypothetical protein
LDSFCKKTPVCCNIDTCCFDTANSYIAGHVAIDVEIWLGRTSADCSGSPDAGISFETDYTIRPVGCGHYYGNTTPFPFGVPMKLANTTLVVNGSPSALPPGSSWPYTLGAPEQRHFEAGWQYSGGGAWTAQIQFALDNASWPGFNSDSIRAAPFSIYGSGDVGGSNVFSGDCSGVTQDPTCGPYCQHLESGSPTNIDIATNVSGSLTAVLYKNYCCRKANGTCFINSVPQTNGDGSCNPLPP